MSDPLHVFPENDLIEHDLEGDSCPCAPYVEYIDPETGVSYPSGPLIIHHSLDGREYSEERRRFGEPEPTVNR